MNQYYVVVARDPHTNTIIDRSNMKIQGQAQALRLLSILIRDTRGARLELIEVEWDGREWVDVHTPRNLPHLTGTEIDDLLATL